MIDRSKRRLLAGGAAVTAIAGAAWLKPKDRGQNHSDYFVAMSRALDQAQLSKPTLVIDRQALDHNIASLKTHIGSRFDYRVVGKSLPSLPLLDRVMQGSGSQRLMMFHQPFLNQVAARFPSSDVLMGKPMPAQAAANFYQQLAQGSQFDSERQLQWLVDSPERLMQYQALGQQLKQRVNINLELDVGLHRGGIANDEVLAEMIAIIESSEELHLSGFMGYEPHVAKVPGDKIALRDKAMAVYSQRLQTAQSLLKKDLSHLTLNAAGSPTYRYYCDDQNPLEQGVAVNELAAGSCLVKPLDFDLPTLTDHRPASFIATPVIKALDQTQLPGVPGLGDLMARWNPNRQKSFFTYGGYWKARPESPKGLSTNPVFGRSTNQEMYNGSNEIDLSADDWLFLRPTQSEFVFLQFGDIAVFDSEKNEIVDFWPVFSAT